MENKHIEDEKELIEKKKKLEDSKTDIRDKNNGTIELID